MQSKITTGSRSINPVHSAFKTKSLQRPTYSTPNPGPGTHRVNMRSVEGNIRDSGATMRCARRWSVCKACHVHRWLRALLLLPPPPLIPSDDTIGFAVKGCACAPLLSL